MGYFELRASRALPVCRVRGQGRGMRLEEVGQGLGEHRAEPCEGKLGKDHIRG